MAIYELGNSSGNGGISLPIEISDVNQLETTLNNLETTLNNTALLVHRHTVADIDNLQTELTRIESIANGTIPPTPPPPSPPSSAVITFNIGTNPPPGVILDFQTLYECFIYIKHSDVVNKGTVGCPHYGTIRINIYKLATIESWGYLTGKALARDIGLDLLNTTIIISCQNPDEIQRVSSGIITLKNVHTVIIQNLLFDTQELKIEIGRDDTTQKTIFTCDNIRTIAGPNQKLLMVLNFTNVTFLNNNSLYTLHLTNSIATNQGTLSLSTKHDIVTSSVYISLIGSEMTNLGTVNITGSDTTQLDTGMSISGSSILPTCKYSGSINISKVIHGIHVESLSATVIGGSTPEKYINISLLDTTDTDLYGVMVIQYPCFISNIKITGTTVTGSANSMEVGVYSTYRFVGKNISINNIYLPYFFDDGNYRPGDHVELYDNVSDIGTIGAYSMRISTINNDLYEPIITGASMAKPYLYLT